MTIWRYTIEGKSGMIVTRNYKYAEEKSRLGYLVFCKRETNIYKFNH